MSKTTRKQYQLHIGMNNARNLLTMDEQDVDGSCVRYWISKASGAVVAFNVNFREFYI